ncbi:single-strand DNA-binding protein [Breznakibacter xylanolyticus]|uniref:Single-stranded DNA-binding protein n=1 Tax=Breznakibacter xylanolyticus TaxID=990 RepID=A0A2W7MZ39_9BACT|nr:single-stranded DNA-binding protein [Breznakibacter xylanolyticus]MBN2744796.1 single-stranded DNA-binding protein [Marinilabiliaceae bacterium]PZX12941.1 single-strand DNA-binding protein [Breznakibacter xylanolyticus]
MLKMILNGNLAEDAELRQVGSRTAINFKIGVNMDYYDGEGKKVERTEWVKAVWWKNENQSTKVSDYLKKGKRVLIEGIPSADAYKSKEGDPKSYLCINVKELELVN